MRVHLGSVKGPVEPFMSGLGDNSRDALGVCSRSSTLIWVGVPMEAPIEDPMGEPMGNLMRDPMGDPMGNLMRDPMGDPIEGALDSGKFYLISKT